jgi:hypothetical protein
VEYVEVLAPTVVVALIFWFVVRSLFRVDRNERRAEAEADARAAGTHGPTPGPPARPADPDNPGDDAGR